MLTGAHRALDDEPNFVGIHSMYKRHDSSHFYHVPDTLHVHTLTSYGTLSTHRYANLAYLKRRNEWKRLCAIIEFIDTDDRASLGSSPYGFSDAGTLHQLIATQVKMPDDKTDIGIPAII